MHGENTVDIALHDLPPFRRAHAWVRTHEPLAPHLTRCLRHQLQLAPLLVPRQQVTWGRGRKAALWTQRQALDWHVLRRLVDATPELILRLKLRVLRANQAEHHHLSWGHEAQGLEATSPLGVVLQQKAVDLEQVKGLLGDDFIASGGTPGAAVVAPAHVESDGHPSASGVLEGGVVRRDRLVEGLIEILAGLPHLLAGM